MKAISSECRRKKEDYVDNDEERSRWFARIITRYASKETLSRDRRWLIETYSIRFCTIWFCTITRMNRRNLTSLRERTRPSPGARRYTRAYWRGIFPVKSINPVEFSVAVSRIRARFVVVSSAPSALHRFLSRRPQSSASQAGKENT